MKHLLTVFVALLGSPLLAQDSERTWEGRWNNQKYNTNGPLKCVAASGEVGEWKATFSGLFGATPFTYDVTFQGKPGGGQQALSGTSTIQGYRYDWTGSLKGTTLTGRYRGRNGYFGQFVLKESGKK